MQVKTIEKNIQKKMNEWLLTITDEELRRKVKNNLLVSGGSIVSLFSCFSVGFERRLWHHFL